MSSPAPPPLAESRLSTCGRKVLLSCNIFEKSKKLINWKICRNCVDRSLFKLSVPVLLVTWYHESYFLLSPPGYQLLVFFKPKSRKTGLVLLFWLLKMLSGSKRSFCSVSVTIGFFTPDIWQSQAVSPGFFSAFVEKLAFSPFLRPLTSFFSVVTVIQRMSKMPGDWSEWTDTVLCFSTFSTVNFACVRLVRRTNSVP